MAVTRSLPAEGLGTAFVAAGERLRVLMVISRPRGAADVGYRMIARPLLERLEAVRGRVELVVLRPPTLVGLEADVGTGQSAGHPVPDRALRRPRRVGGSGTSAGDWRPPRVPGAGDEGSARLRGAEWRCRRRPGRRIRPGPGRREIPVVVLNACQSGAVGTEIEAAVATRLLQEGAASVVAMGYTVYAVAAAEFMAAFYERLFAGGGTTEAVGRGPPPPPPQTPAAQPEGKDGPGRLAGAGPLPAPGRAVSVPGGPGAPSAGLLDDALDRLREGSADRGGGELDPAGAFVGRDGLFYELEVAARLDRVVVLHGPGGTGKSELAKAFGRWWRDTGGVRALRLGHLPFLRAGRGLLWPGRRDLGHRPSSRRHRLRPPRARAAPGRSGAASGRAPPATDLGQLRDRPHDARPHRGHPGPRRRRVARRCSSSWIASPLAGPAR